MKNKLTFLLLLFCTVSFGQTYRFSSEIIWVNGNFYKHNYCQDSIRLTFTKDSLITQNCRYRASIGEIPFTMPKEPNCKKKAYWGHVIYIVSIYKDSIIYEAYSKGFKTKYYNEAKPTTTQ